MALALVQSVIATGASVASVTTAGINTTTGNLLVADGATYTRDGVTSDNNGPLTWTNVAATGAITGRLRQDYSKNITGKTGHTFTLTCTGGNDYPTICVREISGADTTAPLDKSATDFTSGNSTSHTTANTATTSQANEIICGCGSSASACTYTAGGSYTQDQNQATGSNEGLISARKIVSATGAYAFDFTTNNSVAARSIVSTYIEASGGTQTVTLTGVSSAFAAGTIKVNQNLALTGVASAFAAGTNKVNENISLSGVASVFAAGSHEVRNVQIVTLTGVASAFAAGTNTVSVSGAAQNVTLSGVASAFAAGTTTVKLNLALSGVASAFAAGTIKANQTILLAGVASAFASGTLEVDGGEAATPVTYRKLINLDDAVHIDTVLH